MTRDFTGYGGEWPHFRWPNGQRLAVSVVANFEEGAEEQVGDGDAASERVGEALSVVAAGRRDIGQEHIFAYGMRAGIWRMADSLQRHDITATIFICGRAVERSPQLARILVERGHEAACHGWRWRPHADYDSPEAEARELDRASAVIQSATGERPLGFFCRGSESVGTRRLLVERGYLYTSNGLGDDLPYHEGLHPPLVVVSYALDTNDMKFFHRNGFVRAREMVEYVTDAPDVLEAEAARGLTRPLNVGFHPRIVGRPARFAAFQAILEELSRRRSRLWLARRVGIARAFLDAVPRP